MNFTEGDLLEFEKMMKEVPPGGKIAAISSSTLAPWPFAEEALPKKTPIEKKEAAENECGQ